MEVSLYEALKFVKDQPGLKAFLELDLHIYAKFLYNVTHHCNDHYHIYRNFNVFSPISSFEWAESIEGDAYWSKISDEFRQFKSEL